MSAYIVADKTINRIVNRLVYEVQYKSFSEYLQRKLSKLGYNFRDNSSIEKLANDMFTLNVSAVRQRYNDKEEGGKFTYIHGELSTLIQTLKSLNCWIYQCTEGDVPESKLYKFFADDFQNYLLKKIVYEMPEYDKAEWA